MFLYVVVSVSNLQDHKNRKRTDRVDDFFTTTIIDELSLESYLNPVPKGMGDKVKEKYENVMSEYNIKRKVDLGSCCQF